MIAAVTVLRHAQELDSASIDAKYALALALQSAGQAKEAIPLFQDTVAARPSDSAALTNLGLALVQTGDAKAGLTLLPARPTRSTRRTPFFMKTPASPSCSRPTSTTPSRSSALASPSSRTIPSSTTTLASPSSFRTRSRKPSPHSKRPQPGRSHPRRPALHARHHIYAAGPLPDAARELEKNIAMRPTTETPGLSWAASTSRWISPTKLSPHSVAPSNYCPISPAPISTSPPFSPRRETPPEPPPNARRPPT